MDSTHVQLKKRTLATSLSLIILILWSCPLMGLHRISVVKSDDNQAHDKALGAFLEAMGDVEVIYTHNLKGQAKMEDECIMEIRNSKPDLILALGTTATLVLEESFYDMPIVFCMVLNPISSGIIKNMETPGRNITGASLDIPLKLQFEYIKLLLPKVKTIGVMYNPKETAILIQDAMQTTKSMGLSLVAEPVSSHREIPDALKKLVDKTDVLWSVADGTVFGQQSTQYILLCTLRAGMPFIGLSDSFARAGALMALCCDYEDIGKQTAEIATRILNGENPGDIPVTLPRKVFLWLNLRTADQIGLHVPADLIKLAHKVIR